jgi:hypothetical protein
LTQIKGLFDVICCIKKRSIIVFLHHSEKTEYQILLLPMNRSYTSKCTSAQTQFLVLETLCIQIAARYWDRESLNPHSQLENTIKAPSSRELCKCFY